MSDHKAYRYRMISVVRHQNSVNGNPSWTLVLQDEESERPPFSRRLPKDAAAGYQVTESMEGRMVDLTINRQGSIISIEKVQDDDCTATGFSGEGRCIEPASRDGLCDTHLQRRGEH